MLTRPSNAAFLLGMGSPHLLAASSPTATSTKNHDQMTMMMSSSKQFLQQAASILANPACTDHALWVNQIVLKGCRQRVVRDEKFLNDFTNRIRAETSLMMMNNNRNSAAMRKMFDLVNQLRTQTQQQQHSGEDPWITMLNIIDAVDFVSKESPEAAAVKECEARIKSFKQSNRDQLDKVFGNNNNNNNNNSSKNNTSAAASSTTSPKGSSKLQTPVASGTSSMMTSNFPLNNNNNNNNANVAATSSASSPGFCVDVHGKVNQTNLNVIRATMISLREEVDQLRQSEKNSPSKILVRDLEAILEEAKSRIGLHLVEKWQTQRDKERGKTGNDYGTLVEDYAWRHSIPFLLMSVCNDDFLLATTGKRAVDHTDEESSTATASTTASTSTTEEQEYQHALGERWQKWSLQERLQWFERCQTMELTEEEIARADQCWCPKCVDSGKTQPLNQSQLEQDKASSILLNLPALSSESTKHVDTIRRPDRDETKAREKFRLFRRYCWRMKLPFLRLIQNVAYTTPRTKEEKNNNRQSVKGELDGMLVNVCHCKKDGLAVLAIIEVKMNPADLVYARAQRERFVETMKSDRGETMTFSCQSVEDYGMHMSLYKDRFKLFLSDPSRRWVFCTVRNKMDKLSLPFYSKISHLFVRSMASIAGKNSSIMEQLPDFTELAKEHNLDIANKKNEKSSKNNNNHNIRQQKQNNNKKHDDDEDNKESGQRRPRSPNNNSASSDSSFAELKAWIDLVRSHYSNWTPTDDDCQKISYALFKSWEKVVQDSSPAGSLQPPAILLREDDAIRRRNFALLQRGREHGGEDVADVKNETDAPGSICWIDLPQGATPQMLKQQ